MNILVGQSQLHSYRDGDAHNALFNAPTALVLYSGTIFPEKITQNCIPYLLYKKTIYSDCVISSINYPSLCETKLETSSEVSDNSMIRLKYPVIIPNNYTNKNPFQVIYYF